MATENKEKAKGEAIFPLTQEQINQIAAIGAKEGVRAYKEEQKKEERRRKKEDSKVRKTKKLLSSLLFCKLNDAPVVTLNDAITV